MGHSSSGARRVPLPLFFRTASLVVIFGLLFLSPIPSSSQQLAEPAGAAASAGSAPEWNTVAGNPQRTSWTPEEVSGQLTLEWYRPIEAYIPQNVQIIAANGLLYISTSRGLYALYATDPDGAGPIQAGDVKWRYDTELPLGNSPTVVNGVAYVGGYDRKIHVLDALSGVHLWSFDQAQAGYSSNPLVVNGVVYAGNRDGYMYAIGAQGSAQQGQLIWRFKAGGPIFTSAAYNNGTIYFAARDNFAYALDANTGALTWVSPRMPGETYQSFWPVVYRDKVIFSGASSYRSNLNPGTRSVSDPANPPSYETTSRMEKDDVFFDKLMTAGGSGGTVGPTVAISETWSQGKTVIDGSRLIQYYEDDPNPDAHLHKPWRRTYIVLNASDGSEYTFDSNGNGYPEYAPIAFWATASGNQYPPLVGPDDVIYQNNIYSISSGSTYDIPQGRIMGWKVGTPLLSLMGGEAPIDEPQAISAGGNKIYRSDVVDRQADFFDLYNPSARTILWTYDNPLSNIAPGYDVMWWGITDGLPRYTGNYGTKNGQYHNHGVQNPLVPYQGRLFVHRSNAIIAYGPNPGAGQRPLLSAGGSRDSLRTPLITELKQRLEIEIQKMITAGHLRPGYYNAGQFGYPLLADYFDNPGDTIYTLTRAYPYLSSQLQGQVRTYLKSEFTTYFNNPEGKMYARIGWADGAPREDMITSPEVAAALSTFPKTDYAGADYFIPWSYPQHNFYAMWKYAQIFPEDAVTAYNLAKSKLQVPPNVNDPNLFKKWPWLENAYIAGYLGFLNLQQLAGKDVVDSTLRTSVSNQLASLVTSRASDFTKDTYWIDPATGGPATGGNYHYRVLNTARNFMMLVPELRDQMEQAGLLATFLPKVQDAVNEYNYTTPYWFVSRYEAAPNEGAAASLYDYSGMFQAKAYLLKEPVAQLTKYLDAPSFAQGDLFYIQNLVASIEAPDPPPVFYEFIPQVLK